MRVSPILRNGRLIAYYIAGGDMKYIIAWMLGVPGGLILLWFLFSHMHWTRALGTHLPSHRAALTGGNVFPAADRCVTVICGWGLFMKYSNGLTRPRLFLFPHWSRMSGPRMKRAEMGVAYIFVLGSEAIAHSNTPEHRLSVLYFRLPSNARHTPMRLRWRNCLYRAAISTTHLAT